jgi:hypothetical protein
MPNRRLRIAVLSTVYKATPPVGYGGIERVVHTFVEGLIRAGHEVTLFGAAGSRCSGRTVELTGYDPTTALRRCRRRRRPRHSGVLRRQPGSLRAGHLPT